MRLCLVVTLQNHNNNICVQTNMDTLPGSERIRFQPDCRSLRAARLAAPTSLDGV